MLIYPPRLAAIGLAIAALGAAPSFAQTDTTDLRAAITALKADNADLAKLVEYADVLRELANDDPASARAARAPMARCLDTPLRRYCPLMRGLFNVEDAR